MSSTLLAFGIPLGVFVGACSYQQILMVVFKMGAARGVYCIDLGVKVQVLAFYSCGIFLCQEGTLLGTTLDDYSNFVFVFVFVFVFFVFFVFVYIFFVFVFVFVFDELVDSNNLE